ncbi:uncharacterized protein ColSpa_01982 [Colletotrichum spaethianum]|uniref:Uncharacterized protein n=1 Tax=Colletotrichum spaethianum TaxID=700344 RepID=A0AA37L4F3_9PEZI|nr:uncharacterized protein ColSpa_01982 [Colletotrichum spaethianum]GKT41801.1 hypothetical protein ColSpa_01982 [Colletotrichum spaethianum]
MSPQVIRTTSQEAMQHCEKQEDNETGQQLPQADQNASQPAEKKTQSSAAGLSAQGPIASSKLWAIQQFWSKHVSVVVDFETCRDHLGK